VVAVPRWYRRRRRHAPAHRDHRLERRATEERRRGGLLLGLGGGFILLAAVVGFFAFRAYQSGKNAKDCPDESQPADHRIEACRATCAKNAADDACRIKGELLVSSGDASKVTEGVEALKASCTAGSAKACRRAAMASMFPPKGGPPRDPKGGASLADKACTMSAPDCAPKGVAIEYGWLQGSATPTDVYEKACAAGDSEACVFGDVYAARHGSASKAAGASTAATLLRSRCATHDVEACAVLGVAVESSAKSEAEASFKTACDAGDSLGCVNLGKVKVDGGDEAGARDLFKKACDAGEPAACNDLGALETGQPLVDRLGPRGAHAYKLFCGGALSAGCSGWGDPKTPTGKVDLGDAVTQFEKACDMGLLTACVNQGALVLVGQGGPRDRTRAESLFQRACDGGDPGGCGESATLVLQDRVGHPRDDKKGFTLMKEACDGGELDACANVAVLRLLDRGDGGAKSEAMSKLKSYCDQKGLWCDSLGDFYAAGGGGLAQDPVEARRLYEKSCANGLGHAGTCPAYAEALQNGFGGPRDPGKARDLLTKACDHNDFEACSKLGFLYEDGNGVPKDPTKAMALYQKGCDLGHAMSCNALSALYAYGVGVARDAVKAAALAREACEGGYAGGCGSYGIMLANGIGSTKDPANARPFLEVACRADKKEACDELSKHGFPRP
jgi:TPR repeat protein